MNELFGSIIVQPKTVLYGDYMQVKYFADNCSIKITDENPTKNKQRGHICLSKIKSEKKECQNIIKALQDLVNMPIEQPNGSYNSIKNYPDNLHIHNEIQQELILNGYDWLWENVWVYDYINDLQTTTLVPFKIKIHNVILKTKKRDCEFTNGEHEELDWQLQKLELIQKDVNNNNINDINVPLIMSMYYDSINCIKCCIHNAKTYQPDYCDCGDC